MLSQLLVSDFNGMTSCELIAIMAKKDDNPKLAEHAFIEFHRRFMAYVYVICESQSRLKGITKEHERQEIANNAFLSAYNGAKTFNPRESKTFGKNADRVVKSWLGQITRNAILVYFREYERVYRLSDAPDYETLYGTCEEKKNSVYASFAPIDESVLSMPHEEDEFTPESKYKRELLKALKNLKPRDRDILITYLEFEDENGNIPPEIRKRLCKRYHLADNYPTKIKQRSFNTLKLSLNNIEKSNNYESKIKKKGRRKVRERTESGPARHGRDDPGDTEAG